jgi:hypothetical protein
MNNIKGYMVRMWTSDGRVNNEKFFSAREMLKARKAAFEYAHNLAHVMEEARKQGVINFNTPEEILDPESRMEEVVIGNVYISIVYEEISEGVNKTDEDIIYMIVSGEENNIDLPPEEAKLVLKYMELFDPRDPETIRISNREAFYYIRNGGFNAIRILKCGLQSVFLLMDDYWRLVEKELVML